MGKKEKRAGQASTRSHSPSAFTERKKKNEHQGHRLHTKKTQGRKKKKRRRKRPRPRHLATIYCILEEKRKKGEATASVQVTKKERKDDRIFVYS